MDDGSRESERITDLAHGPIAATEPVTDRGPSAAGAASGSKGMLPVMGYDLGVAIGRGGMGEVIAAFDRRIGREVAIKRMRSPHPSEEATARFLREARIQAWLDHPAVVPVHELGTDDAGRPYFTMKRISGRTLDQLIREGAAQNRLLRAFVDVCLAIERAHACGVIHRDLKPSNIILGGYGEVYVLDWGIARVLPGTPMTTPLPEAEPEPPGAGEPEPGGTPPDPSEASTKTGTVLGTPGFISPEQLDGSFAGPPADVYALGAILFELLAREPLHPQGPQAAIASTVMAPQVLPSARRPDLPIPPELDRICHDALAPAPAERPTAHQLADQVQAYLDGDRDVERRRKLAAQQLDSAYAALASQDPEARPTALRRAGRALALDPESTGAADLVTTLVLEPPSTASSPRLAASLERHERQMSRDRSRKAMFAYLSVFALLPAIFLIEVKSWALLAGGSATVALGALSSWVHARKGRQSLPVAFTLSLALAILFSRIASPFVLTPFLLFGALAALTSIPAVAERPWLVMAWTTTAVMAPFVLEWAGVLNSTWDLGLDKLELRGDLLRAHGHEDIALAVAHLLLMLIVTWFALSLSRRRHTAQRQLYVQAWHLGQLVPASPTGMPAAGAGRARPVRR